jgi:hypothetical protein
LKFCSQPGANVRKHANSQASRVAEPHRDGLNRKARRREEGRRGRVAARFTRRCRFGREPGSRGGTKKVGSVGNDLPRGCALPTGGLLGSFLGSPARGPDALREPRVSRMEPQTQANPARSEEGQGLGITSPESSPAPCNPGRGTALSRQARGLRLRAFAPSCSNDAARVLRCPSCAR